MIPCSPNLLSVLNLTSGVKFNYQSTKRKITSDVNKIVGKFEIKTAHAECRKDTHWGFRGSQPVKNIVMK